MRKTIINHQSSVDPYLRDGPLCEPDYKCGLKKIHDYVPTDTTRNYPDNKVLLTRPPRINIDDEKGLSRKARSTLSQLRSGYSPFLNTYRHRIDSKVSFLCPDCRMEEHTTTHLFNCAANQTNLSPQDLWLNPSQCAEFLKLNVDDAST